MCGEKENAEAMRVQFQGSPPHVRGKDFLLLHWLFAQGITPAYAGKRESRSASGSACRDHPRMCGEKVSAKLHPALRRGSPPHVRGKVPLKGLLHITCGITPAHAGKSG